MSNKGRTIFIGDIHGCFDEFMLLLEKINLQENDRVYLTGDLINRGPKELDVLKFLVKNKNQFKSVMGNSELCLKLYKEQKLLENYEFYQYIEKQYNDYNTNHKELLEYLLSLPGYIEEDEFTLIHGSLGLNSDGTNIDKLPLETLTDIYWRSNNQNDWYKTYTGTKKIIYGHNALYGININGNTIGIDSGCDVGGYLTAYTLETGDIKQVKAFKKYY